MSKPFSTPMAASRWRPTSNLQSFLNHTTPVVPSQSLPRSSFHDFSWVWDQGDSETIECFALKDLWSCYDEWSAYGAGAPVVVSTAGAAAKEKETIVQYYVPYLSAMQIYVSARSLQDIRRMREEEVGEKGEDAPEYSKEFAAADSLSEDSESDGASRTSESFSSENNYMSSGSLSSSSMSEAAAWQLSDRLGCLYFDYFEVSSPYGRVPLADKIRGFSDAFHGLTTLRSVDLSPASWMAVSWYPIYHIPTYQTAKDLSTCFLTYHTISSSFQDDWLEDGGRCMEEKAAAKKKKKGIALPAFGLATYKMHGDVWVDGDDSYDHLQLLVSGANSWLKQLRVHHHDYSFFTRAHG